MPWTKEVRWLSPISMGLETILFPFEVTAGHISNWQGYLILLQRRRINSQKQEQKPWYSSLPTQIFTYFLHTKSTHSFLRNTHQSLIQPWNQAPSAEYHDSLFIRLDVASLPSDISLDIVSSQLLSATSLGIKCPCSEHPDSWAFTLLQVLLTKHKCLSSLLDCELLEIRTMS